ncbi:MAG: glycoside hydrolase family 15 protein [Campylobacterales bacterium]|nr:glycoside hydrolase family 15 protein [Campylobacterales bacterium]
MNLDRAHRALDRHFVAVERIILSRQDAVTGLLPASTAVNAHGDYTDAWVRDNVYSILCVWGLALSYRKFHPDHHRTYLLSQSVVKLMRGLLGSMMRQSDRVERFKHSLQPADALHAKYGTKTALAVVGDHEWGHLQLDATSLYLLMIAQMTASGLRLIYTLDEVQFVQNLVHYISRTYCTPDYGIWERGNKINHGTTEINCSSVGMAKAALEALDGFNLFGNVASQEAVIHVIPNDIARSRFTLTGLLPRESSSKESDAALLSIIGYPAYAVEDAELVERTRGKIIKKLAGRYGCKRFLLDGHQSVIEDTSRLHYEAHELRAFEHIESEWPLFFTYLLLDALMRGDAQAIIEWRQRLEPLFVEQEGLMLLPELYFVPHEALDAERERPGSQTRLPNENLPLVWAQSLFILSEMMLDGILHPSDIDPLHRHSRLGYQRQTVPLVAVLAENPQVKRTLLDLGFESETPEELAPLRILHASELSAVHTLLGKNTKLGLSGRPFLVSRTISSSRLYLLGGEEIVFLPYYFDPKSFYLSYDNKLLVQHFRSSLRFLQRHWDQPGQPLITFLVREEMLHEEERAVVLGLLHDLQRGESQGIVIRTHPMRQLLTTASTERIDNLHGFIFKGLQPKRIGRSYCRWPGNNRSMSSLHVEALSALEHASDEHLWGLLIGEEQTMLRLRALELLWLRRGSEGSFWIDSDHVTLGAIADQIYESASHCQDWAVLRRVAQLTGKYDDRLEDALLDIVIRQKRLAVGRAYCEQGTFSKPVKSTDIVRLIETYCGNNTAEAVLTQEVVLHLGHLIRSEPELFDHMLTLRTWYFIQLLVGQISREYGCGMGEAYERLLGCSPHSIYERLRAVFLDFGWEIAQMRHREHLHGSGFESIDAIKTAPLLGVDADVEDWAQWRSHAGMIGRLPSGFYKDIWHLLQRCKGLVIGDKYSAQTRIGSELTLDATAGERSFELRIDTLLQGIEAPEYRQLNIEVIGSLARLLRHNPDIRIENDLVLDVLIGHAVRIAWHGRAHEGTYDEERSRAWEAIYRLSPPEVEKAFVEAFMFLLKPQEDFA